MNQNAAKCKLLEIYSIFCKVHQSACFCLKNQGIGISYGGKTTKIYVIVNEKFQLLKVMLRGEQVHDSECDFDLFDDIDFIDKTILANRAYSYEKIRNYIENHRATVCISDKSNFKITHFFDCQLYK